jgi:2-dehydropantoate 2-reductase
LKICVLGAGALGSVIGARLSEAGNEVWLVSRNAAHVDAIRQHGLKVSEQGHDRIVNLRAVAHADSIDLSSGAVALVIVLVKSFHTRAVIESALRLIGADTTVLSLQNGIGHEDVLASVVGTHRVLAGKTYVGGVMRAPGHVSAGTHGKETFIGELNGEVGERAGQIADTFTHAGLATEVSPHIMTTIWEKLLVNVATGALSAITRLNYGHLYQVPEVEACAVAAVAEAMAVARAAGIAITTTDSRAPWVKAAAGLPFEFKASMLQSIEAGSVTEVDYINGAVVEQGRKYSVPTPVNQTLVACIKGIERKLT